MSYTMASNLQIQIYTVFQKQLQNVLLMCCSGQHNLILICTISWHKYILKYRLTNKLKFLVTCQVTGTYFGDKWGRSGWIDLPVLLTVKAAFGILKSIPKILSPRWMDPLKLWEEGKENSYGRNLVWWKDQIASYYL